MCYKYLYLYSDPLISVPMLIFIFVFTLFGQTYYIHICIFPFKSWIFLYLYSSQTWKLNIYLYSYLYLYVNLNMIIFIFGPENHICHTLIANIGLLSHNIFFFHWNEKSCLNFPRVSLVLEEVSMKKTVTEQKVFVMRHRVEESKEPRNPVPQFPPLI